MAKSTKIPMYEGVRVGRAAEILGVSIDTLRRWEVSGKLRVRRSAGGQRLVGLADIRGVLAERRRKRRPNAEQSARNRFPGVVTRVAQDRVAAVVEVQAAPHRHVRLMTAAAATGPPPAPGAAVVGVLAAAT